MNKHVANLGASQSLESKNAFFSDSFSETAKLLAHLQASQLYLIFNAADRMGQRAIKIWNRVLVYTRGDLWDFDLNITN